MRKLYFTLAVAIFTVGFSSKTINQSVNSYDPIRFGVPKTIGGYRVLAVLTEENFVCMRPGEKRLILQSLQPTIDGALRDFPKERSELAQWESSIVGPGLTREKLINQFEQFYRSFKEHGCASLDLSLDLPNAGTCSPTGECKNPPPYQAYAIIQNTSIHNYSVPVIAQSVILVAPTVGRSQEGIWSDPISEAINQRISKECIPHIPLRCNHHPGYSALLNNGMTDKAYFLQVGFYFTNKATVAGDGVVSPGDQNCQAPAGCFGDGLVVWAGAQATGVQNRDLRPRALFSADTNGQPTAIPYIPDAFW